MKYFPLAFLLLLAASPFAASAATLPPACAMYATSPTGEHWGTYGGTLYVLADAGVPFTVIWGSANATQAIDSMGQPISPIGQQDLTATKTTNYSYTFSSSVGQKVCNVTAVILTSGPGSTAVFTPPVIGTAPSTVNTTATSSTSSFSASMVPLLSGGSATPNDTIPVAYLQLTNRSATSTAFLPGVWLRQDGTARTSSVIGFTTVDDKQLQRGNVGGTEGSILFKNGLAYVPLNASFAPGQFRIYTIKAQLSKNITAPDYGTTLSLDVNSLDTSGTVVGSFPIRGVTWTIQAP